MQCVSPYILLFVLCVFPMYFLVLYIIRYNICTDTLVYYKTNQTISDHNILKYIASDIAVFYNHMLHITAYMLYTECYTIDFCYIILQSSTVLCCIILCYIGLSYIFYHMVLYYGILHGTVTCTRCCDIHINIYIYTYIYILYIILHHTMSYQIPFCYIVSYHLILDYAIVLPSFLY